MHVDLSEHRIAGIDEAMWGVRRNDDEAACLHLALFITDRDGGAAFQGEGDFDVWVRM